MKDELGDRIKTFYEDAYRLRLPRRLPVILRVDGKAFHSYTRGLLKPYSRTLMDAMDHVALALCTQVQGAVLAYTQSDEVTVLVRNDQGRDTSAWLNNGIQKIVSVAASIAGTTMTIESPKVFGKVKPAYFDGRAFVVPEHEVINCFIWRQQDAIRNARQMLAQAHFSPRQLHGKDGEAMLGMLREKGVHFDSEPIGFQRGRCVSRVEWTRKTIHGEALRRSWEVDQVPPIFAQNRDYVEQHLARDEEP